MNGDVLNSNNNAWQIAASRSITLLAEATLSSSGAPCSLGAFTVFGPDAYHGGIGACLAGLRRSCSGHGTLWNRMARGQPMRDSTASAKDIAKAIALSACSAVYCIGPLNTA